MMEASDGEQSGAGGIPPRTKVFHGTRSAGTRGGINPEYGFAGNFQNS